LSIEFRDEMEKLSRIFVSNGEDEAVTQVESELEAIFGDSGKQVLVKEFSSRYLVSVKDAIRRPSEFQIALYYLLGELGSTLVMDRINKRLLTIAPSVVK
jgi:hypothetical protein